MYINNISGIDAAFYILDKKDEKINYYYEPRFTKKEKDWKRSYIINELKKDFISDINNYGFSPYIESSFIDQRKDRNINKYIRVNSYDFASYIKKMNILLHNNPKTSNINIKNDQNKPFPNKIGEINLFHNKFTNKFRRSQSNFNILNNQLAKKRKNRKLSSLPKIVKFSRDDIIDLSKINQMKLINNGIETSFDFGNKNINESFNDDSYQDKPNIPYDKKSGKDNLNINDKDILIRNKYEKLNEKNKNNNMYRSYTKQLFKDNEISNKTVKFSAKFQNKKISNISGNKNIRNTFYKFNNSAIKKSLLIGSRSFHKKRNYLNAKQPRISNKNLYLEKLENYEGGIFKNAKKYQYPVKLSLKKH